MKSTRSLVAEAIDATRIINSTRFSWFGRPSTRLPNRIVSALTANTARDYLVHALSDQLYEDFYLRGRAEPAQWGMNGSAASRRGFETGLSAANGGHGYVDNGWQLLALDAQQAVVAKGGLELSVGRHELVGADDIADPGPGKAGGTVGLRMPKELTRIAPGFYTACGDVPLEPGPRGTLLRFYWHLAPSGAAPFVASATRLLNDLATPFRLKVLSDPTMFRRCDAGVLYVDGASVPVDVAMQLHAELARHLLAPTPVFTQRLAPGLGMAEDPGNGESFGQHRCRMLAEAMVQAHQVGHVGTPQALRFVAERFSRDGVDLDAPHLRRVPAPHAAGSP